MIFFSAPWLLILLPLLWGLRFIPIRRGYAISRLSLLAVMRPTLRLRRREWASFLEFAAMNLALLAAAGPERVDHVFVSTPTAQWTFVLDTSGSMETTEELRDGRPVTRLEMAQSLMNELIDSSADDTAPPQWAVVIFARTAMVAVPPTKDRAAAKELIQEIGVDRHENRTNIGDALVLALSISPTSSSRIVLLSDGGQNVVEGESVGTSAAMAAALVVPIDTVLIGTPKTPEEEREAKAAIETLRQIAVTSGGAFDHLSGASAAVLAQRLMGVTKAEGATRPQTERAEHVDLTFPVLAVAVVLLVAALLIGLETSRL